MKILHCADVHLESKLNKNFDRIKARERRDELINTFLRMVKYAADNNVRAILIAGDLFDSEDIRATARNAVADCIMENYNIDFFYIRGNHDSDGFLEGLKEVPDNLKTFDDSWSTYEIKGKKINVTISAKELKNDNLEGTSDDLWLEEEDINIVMLHGQENERAIREYKDKCIDYLALGHIHSYCCERLDARGVWCYSGCLEARGFDECGIHGFVEIDIDENNGDITHKLIPFAKRAVIEVVSDVRGLESTYEMISKIKKDASGLSVKSDDMIKVVLTGDTSMECEKDVEYIRTNLSEEFYMVKVEDNTRTSLNVRQYLYDESLKGEFVRCVLKDETLNDEDKAQIIRYGIDALLGEVK